MRLVLACSINFCILFFLAEVLPGPVPPGPVPPGPVPPGPVPPGLVPPGASPPPSGKFSKISLLKSKVRTMKVSLFIDQNRLEGAWVNENH